MFSEAKLCWSAICSHKEHILIHLRWNTLLRPWALATQRGGSQGLVELGDLSLHHHYTSVDRHRSLNTCSIPLLPQTSSDLLYTPPTPDQLYTPPTPDQLRPALYTPIQP